MAELEKKRSGRRLDSIDALRGFDMLWIMGMPGIVRSIDQLIHTRFTGWLSLQMEHAVWNGLRLMDLVFPTFLFIAGCSFPFSFEKRKREGQTMSSVYKHIAKRALLLIILGFIYNGLLRLDFDNFRFASVLARIGIAWMVGTLIYIHTSRPGTRLIIAAAILVTYSLVTGLVKAPDSGLYDGIYTPQGSIAGWIDRICLPGKLYLGNFDPEGILSTFPAVVTALLGMVTGQIVLNAQIGKESRPAFRIALSGGVLLISGLLWNLAEPINKSLWTSPFTLVSAGISSLLLFVFYWIIDIRGHKKWAFFFKVIGVNSLVIYIAQIIINFYEVTNFFLGGLAFLFKEEYRNLILSCGYVVTCWFFLYFLYRKRIFLKI